MQGTNDRDGAAYACFKEVVAVVLVSYLEQLSALVCNKLFV